MDTGEIVLVIDPGRRSNICPLFLPRALKANYWLLIPYVRRHATIVGGDYFTAPLVQTTNNDYMQDLGLLQRNVEISSLIRKIKQS